METENKYENAFAGVDWVLGGEYPMKNKEMKIKEGDWVKTDALDGPAKVVVIMSGVLKVAYHGRFYFFREDEVRK